MMIRGIIIAMPTTTGDADGSDLLLSNPNCFCRLCVDTNIICLSIKSVSGWRKMLLLRI